MTLLKTGFKISVTSIGFHVIKRRIKAAKLKHAKKGMENKSQIRALKLIMKRLAADLLEGLACVQDQRKDG